MKNNKLEESFVLYSDESYIETLTACAKSIREFSDKPILVYLINSNKKIDIPNTTTIFWKCNITKDDENTHLNSNGNVYVNRNNSYIYNILIQRANILKHALINYSNIVVYIDSDSIVTPAINNIFYYYPVNSNYPYLSEGIYDWLHKDGKGGCNDINDMSTTLEHPSCELFKVNQYVRQTYRTSNILIAGLNTIWFLDEWNSMCHHPEVLQNFVHYAPFQDETIINVLLWKYRFHNGLPYVYMNGTDTTIQEVFEEIGFNGNSQHIREWLRIPVSKEELFAVHGEKRPDIMYDMIDLIKKYY